MPINMKPLTDALQSLKAQFAEPEAIYCPMCECHDAAVSLGTFGSYLHYRCRCCGWQFSLPVGTAQQGEE